MRFDQIVGQRSALELLRRGLASDRLPHALLFQGPEGVGKGTVARALARALLCETGGEQACGECAACVKVRQRSHPDLLVVRRLSRKIKDSPVPMDDLPEDEEPHDGELSRFIRIFQIRDLCAHAAFSPREGRRRVFILDPADSMNEEAQNALLKTLEEPPPPAFLILVASRPHLLLPTVRSRCLAVRFGLLRPEELARALESSGMPPAEASSRASLARGRVGQALRLDLEALSRRRDEILQALEALAASPQALAELSAMVATVAGRDERSLLKGLDLLEELLRDSILISSDLSADASLDADLAVRLAKLGSRLGSARSAALVGSIERIRGDLRFNLNRTLLTESLLAAVAGGPIP